MLRYYDRSMKRLEVMHQLYLKEKKIEIIRIKEDNLLLRDPEIQNRNNQHQY